MGWGRDELLFLVLLCVAQRQAGWLIPSYPARGKQLEREVREIHSQGPESSL